MFKLYSRKWRRFKPFSVETIPIFGKTIRSISLPSCTCFQTYFRSFVRISILFRSDERDRFYMYRRSRCGSIKRHLVVFHINTIVDRQSSTSVHSGNSQSDHDKTTVLKINGVLSPRDVTRFTRVHDYIEFVRSFSEHTFSDRIGKTFGRSNKRL